MYVCTLYRYFTRHLLLLAHVHSKYGCHIANVAHTVLIQ